ncbi:MAG: hypothetical protein EHM28_12945 [Spirochaetaceae bacterium]|nr:MAG: hypothetical protein EHM28_12945 [Spirochaetaceae bacterium]
MTFFRLVVVLVKKSFFRELSVLNKNNRAKGLVFLVLFGIVLFVMLAAAVFFLKAIYDNIVSTGFFIPLSEVVFFVATVLSWIIIFFLAFPGASGMFFHAKETDLLRSLPVSAAKLTLARLVCLYVSFLPLHLLFCLPACWSYYSVETHDKSHFFGLVTFLVMSPIIPLSLASFGAWVTDRLFNISRWKTVIQSACLFLVFLVLVVFQLLMQEALIGMGGGSGGGNGEVFVLQLAQLFAIMVNAFPPAAWVAMSFFAGNGWLYSILVLSCAAVPATGAFLLLSSRERLRLPALTITPRASLKSQAQSSLQQQSDSQKHDVFGVKRSLTAALLDREFRLLASSPYFAMEAVVTLAVLPALLLLYGIAGSPAYLKIVADVVTLTPLNAILSCTILLLLLDASPISASGIYREGKRLVISKRLPVAGRVQVKAKLVFHLLLSLPSVVLSLGAIYLMFGLPAESLVLVIPSVLLFFIMSFCLSMGIEFHSAFRSGNHAGMSASRLLQTLPKNMSQVPAAIFLAGIAWLCIIAGMSPVFTGVMLMEMLLCADVFLVNRLFANADSFYL